MMEFPLQPVSFAGMEKDQMEILASQASISLLLKQKTAGPNRFGRVQTG
jgi:hypothetical protein